MKTSRISGKFFFPLGLLLWLCLLVVDRTSDVSLSERLSCRRGVAPLLEAVDGSGVAREGCERGSSPPSWLKNGRNGGAGCIGGAWEVGRLAEDAIFPTLKSVGEQPRLSRMDGGRSSSSTVAWVGPAILVTLVIQHWIARQWGLGRGCCSC